MNKSNVSKFVENVKVSTVKHSPEILTGIGIAGMVTTVVFAVRATPKALELIEEEKRRQNYEVRKSANNNYSPITSLKPMEVIKVSWKSYIPTVVLGSMSIACIIGASSVHARRITAISTAYKLSETALTEYKEKVVETIGEKKEQGIRDKVNQERVDKNPVNNSQIIVTGAGNTLFHDVVSNNYFESDIQTVREIINDLNERMLSENYISLSEFLDEFGLNHTNKSDEIGWNLFRDGQIKIDFGSAITKDGRACVVLDYLVAPRYDFSKLI